MKEKSADAKNFISEGGYFKSTIIFISVPSIMMALGTGFGVQLPIILMYGVAVILGLVMFFKSFTNPEYLIAAFIIYIPLSKQLVVPIAPGINGTNILLLMLVVSWVSMARNNDKPLFQKLPNTLLVTIFTILSFFSIITLLLTSGGLSYLLEDLLPQVKGWFEQFLIFFIFINIIRNGAMARRIIIYLMIGTVVAVLIGIQETLEKMNLDSIDKSRVLGPQLQPNDYGAFLVYNLAPFISIFMVYYKKWRVWSLIPFLLIALKVLLSTFSRGAMLGLAASVIVASYVKGKRYIFFGGVLGLLTIMVFPQIIPNSLKDRFGINETTELKEENLDTSSATRLILWKAAVDISLDNPVFGIGFKNYLRYKGRYTEKDVREGDTHNMYLWISSQMGFPTLFIFLLILYRFYSYGSKLYLKHPDDFAKAIGLGGASMVAGILLINMFGSRMIGIDVCGYIWIYMAVVSHLINELDAEEKPIINRGINY